MLSRNENAGQKRCHNAIKCAFSLRRLSTRSIPDHIQLWRWCYTYMCICSCGVLGLVFTLQSCFAICEGLWIVYWNMLGNTCKHYPLSTIVPCMKDSIAQDVCAWTALPTGNRASSLPVSLSNQAARESTGHDVQCLYVSSNQAVNGVSLGSMHHGGISDLPGSLNATCETCQ